MNLHMKRTKKEAGCISKNDEKNHDDASLVDEVFNINFQQWTIEWVNDLRPN